MSACISHRGEYDAHEFGPDAPEFMCTWCGAYDEAAIDAALAEARAKVARVEAELVDIEEINDFLAHSGDTHDAAIGGAAKAIVGRIRAALGGVA